MGAQGDLNFSYQKLGHLAKGIHSCRIQWPITASAQIVYESREETDRAIIIQLHATEAYVKLSFRAWANEWDQLHTWRNIASDIIPNELR